MRVPAGEIRATDYCCDSKKCDFGTIILVCMRSNYGRFNQSEPTIAPAC